jgi:hypothetical protein
VTIELLTWTRARVWCEVEECFRFAEFEIRLDMPGGPDGWPEVVSEGGDLRTRVVAHFCPDHADVSEGHVPVVVKRHRFLRSSLWVTTCSCGRMPKQVDVRGVKAAWIAHITGDQWDGSSIPLV